MDSAAKYRPSRQQFTPSREEQEKLLSGEALPNPHLTRQQVKWGMEEFFKRVLRIHEAKNEDYGDPKDGLLNLRESARRLDLTMPQVVMNLMEKHLIALENDTRRWDRPLNEGVEDRLSDVACYCGLMYLALKEQASA